VPSVAGSEQPRIALLAFIPTWVHEARLLFTPPGGVVPQLDLKVMSGVVLQESVEKLGALNGRRRPEDGFRQRLHIASPSDGLHGTSDPRMVSLRVSDIPPVVPTTVTWITASITA